MNRQNFFSRLFQHGEGQIELRPLPSGNDRIFTEIGDHALIDEFCDVYSQEDCYFGVASRDGQGGGKENLIHIPALWCDLDFNQTPKDIARGKLRTFPFKPSIIVQSGGGIHLYWLLKEPADRADFSSIEDLNRRIAVQLGGDTAATDIARILRIPSTLNHKYKPPRKCELLQLNDFYYTLEDFGEILPKLDTSQKPDLQNGDNNWLSEALQGCSEPGRNVTAAKIAGYYINKLPISDVRQILTTWNQLNKPPLSNTEIDSVVKSIARYEPEKKHNQVAMENVYDAGRMIEEYKRHVKSLKQNRFILGIPEIDKKIRGISGGEVLVLLARSGAFKTATLQNLLLRYTHHSAWGAVFFSIEMPVASVTERYFQIIFGEPGHEVEKMFSGDTEQVAVDSVSRDFMAKMKKLFVIPTRVGLSDIPNYIRLIEAEKNIKVGLVGIDYMGLMEGPGSNAYESMTRLAKGMKSTAKLVGLPLIVLCQTSRKGGTGYQEVSLDMARDSGAVEESADFCLGLWQSETSDAISECRSLVCKILKNRKGPAGASFSLDMDPRTFKLGSEAWEYKPPRRKNKCFDGA